MKVVELRRFGAVLGREGLAQLALEIAQEIVKEGSYKGAIAGAGKMQAVVKACTFDEYWDGKATAGARDGEFLLANKANSKVIAE